MHLYSRSIVAVIVISYVVGLHCLYGPTRLTGFEVLRIVRENIGDGSGTMSRFMCRSAGNDAGM